MPGWDQLRQDVRYAIRSLTKTPSWTAVAALTVAMGMAGTATMFSVANAVLLRPLPFSQPHQLYWIGELLFNFKQEFAIAADYLTMREHAQVFSEMAAFNTSGVNWTGRDRPEQLTVSRVTASFFSLLGVPPLRGRVFRADEDVPEANLTVVLSYDLWQRRFGGDPAILGKTIRLDRQPALVVGVMPRGFDFPKGTELWMPFRLNEAEQRLGRSFVIVSILARVRGGVSPARVVREMNRLTPIVENEYHAHGSSADAKIFATPLQERLAGEMRPAILVLAGAVALMLAIICFNVANLMLARANGRRREITIRAALGAPAKRIASQLVTESVFVSLLGGALGIAITSIVVAILNSSRPLALAGFPEVSVDAATLGFTFGLSLLMGLIFGLAPAIRALGFSLREALQQESRSTAGSLSLRRLTQGLVAAQLGASLTLLIGSGLLAKSFLKLRDSDPGFRPDRILTARINLTGPSYSSRQRQIEFYENVLEKLRGAPSVVSAAVTSSIPLNGDGLPNSAVFRIENHPTALRGQEPQTSLMAVSPEFFNTLSIPLLAGRLLDARDRPGSPETIVVNQAFRRSFFPNEDPIGRRITIGITDNPVWLEIVGVVGDVRQNGLDRDAEPWFYQCYVQGQLDMLQRMGILIRTSSDFTSLPSMVARLVTSIDSDQPIYDVKTMDQRLADSLASRRFNAVWIGCFAVAAMVLAAIGVYGVMSYLVTLRTQEIGIRLALGARPGQVIHLIVREGLVLAIAGSTIGLAGAYALRRFLSLLLFGVSTLDPAVYLGFTAALLIAVLAACYGPGRRAARVDPMTSLRHD
jgi:putative ABC transport system permease protein